MCNSSLHRTDTLALPGLGLSYRPTMTRLFFSLCLICMFVVTAGAVHARDVVVFAAASLKNVLDDALMQYEAQSGATVAVSYAGSSALARQIQQGAPADIFVSANIEWMDYLEDEDMLVPATRRVLAGNRLVLIAPQDTEFDGSLSDFQAALGPQGRLAMALVDAVPAGMYGRAALSNMGVWSDLAPSVVQTDNVRAALRLVSLGEAQLGIVYATDARLDETVVVLSTFDDDLHRPIKYPAAQIAESTHPQAADVLDFLSGPDAQAIFFAHGFLRGGPE